MQHIDAIHLIPWNIQMDQKKNDIKCSECEFVGNSKDQLDNHANQTHKNDIENLLTESK